MNPELDTHAPGRASMPEPCTAPTATGFIFGDFELRGGKIFLRKTGNFATLDGALVREVAIWLGYHFVVRLKALLHRLIRRPGPAIWFTPDVPHPRYMVRTAAIWGGIRIAKSPREADVAFSFEDATVSPSRSPILNRHFNFGCNDISKSHVAAVFAEVFGYPLAIDPRHWTGEAVEKSEANGTHDGRIVQCPRDPLPDRTYQRLIDTIGADGFACDLRTHCINGVAVVVWVKKRSPSARFLPPNISATRHAPEAIFSDSELARISRFVKAIGADWCGLDVLRDEPSGRIYVVDVNKTDAGPLIALSLREKIASTAILANALLGMIEASAPV